MNRKRMFVLASVVLAPSCGNDYLGSLLQNSDDAVFAASMKAVA